MSWWHFVIGTRLAGRREARATLRGYRAAGAVHMKPEDQTRWVDFYSTLAGLRGR